MSGRHAFDNIQDMLIAEGFAINGDFFVKGAVAFPAVEIVGHTVGTFAEKARLRGWIGSPIGQLSDPFVHVIIASQGVDLAERDIAVFENKEQMREAVRAGRLSRYAWIREERISRSCLIRRTVDLKINVSKDET